MSKSYRNSTEWIKQAEYDLDTAYAMFREKRYIYAIFMSQLSAEKILKGLYAKKFKHDPPRTHDSVYLLEKIKIKLPHNHRDFLEELNDLSVPTRYPHNLENLLKQYNQKRTEEVFNKTKALIQWLKEKI